jgi:hypothetical protein
LHVPSLTPVATTLVSQCDPTIVTLKNNKYYTTHGNATIKCGGTPMSVAECQTHGMEIGSTAAKLPSDEVGDRSVRYTLYLYGVSYRQGCAYVHSHPSPYGTHGMHSRNRAAFGSR